MSRNLNDDFDEDDLPGGSLDLEKGSGGVGTGATSSYDGGGREFEDDPYGDGLEHGGSLELDLPHGSATALRTGMSGGPPPPRAAGPSVSARGPAGGPAVPDLALPPPPVSSSAGPKDRGRTSGAHPAAVVSARPPPAPVSSAPSMAAASAPPSSSGSSLTANDSGGHAPASGSVAALNEQLPPARPTAASVIAKYPAPPPKPLQAPKYAVQILLRQFELRNQLESLRRRRSPDVPLYEAALRSYDVKTFRLGMAINCALLATATLIFFLPVILRFVRAD